jgi:hypothetical protein
VYNSLFEIPDVISLFLKNRDRQIIESAFVNFITPLEGKREAQFTSSPFVLFLFPDNGHPSLLGRPVAIDSISATVKEKIGEGGYALFYRCEDSSGTQYPLF